MKLRKWKALLTKDLKLTFNNKGLIVLMLFPVGFALLYSKLMGTEIPAAILLIMVTIMGMMMLGSSAMGMSIAEEKEKKTLRSLMISDVSGVEFLLSKMIVISILFLLVLLACFFIVGMDVSYLPMYLSLIIPTTFSLLLMSSIVGILSPNQQTVGVLGLPVMLVAAIPLFSLMTDNAVFMFLMKIVPTGPMTLIMAHEVDMMMDYTLWMGYGSMALWIVVSLILFTFFYKRKQLD